VWCLNFLVKKLSSWMAATPSSFLVLLKLAKLDARIVGFASMQTAFTKVTSELHLQFTEL